MISYPTNDIVSAATVAVQVGNQLWAGSFRGERIARYPAKGLRPPKSYRRRRTRAEEPFR